MTDSPEYLKKRAFFDSLLTIYGRKPVLEALEDQSLPVHKLHLADSNRKDQLISRIEQLAAERKIDVAHCDRKELSRISKNARQDQGVALDLALPHYGTAETFLEENSDTHFELLALDGITNPQNLGMIIRSACAGGIDGIILPRKGCAQIDPLVIKASVGTLFKTRILRCDQLAPVLEQFAKRGARVCALSSHAHETLQTIDDEKPNIFVLGNETHGVGPAVDKACTHRLRIPMQNGVESLNVAITAALISFRHQS
ncbi:TrmH family RNA methyltransferase [Microbulbifer hydrolyticus]|uniref:23S rRNA (Guanosine(2251)-2'-O)-methyltransferase RlmB n=1 Tax=Microbulbifer hydrolyticus TaxID=48074 RepID=A0A6P1TDB9_9GAMM|nr:RNA methyltransferase [Microbulbifer hydrolyticus]MBB5209912.1 23S rRNA (guanosine2251-2'-O)-methyltransferase [Microbulbifer hydrolyticus]QHQ39550.1 23S rRNA (guanosine(2251)-2'-O)-methyltransferase RlmB [Microbulbifer hydrolyticus]